MGASFDFPILDVFTTGTIGDPGQRVFYLQARHGALLASLRLEKQQVALLAEHVARILADLPAPTDDELPDDLDLTEPVVAEWIVGQIGIGHDADEDRILVVAHELVDEEDEEAVEEGGVARFLLTRGQAAVFVARAATIVTAGRPLCPLCGNPMDPEGHICPRTNGHKPR